MTRGSSSAPYKVLLFAPAFVRSRCLPPGTVHETREGGSPTATPPLLLCLFSMSLCVRSLSLVLTVRPVCTSGSRPGWHSRHTTVTGAGLGPVFVPFPPPLSSVSLSLLFSVDSLVTHGWWLRVVVLCGVWDRGGGVRGVPWVLRGPRRTPDRPPYRWIPTEEGTTSAVVLCRQTADSRRRCRSSPAG